MITSAAPPPEEDEKLKRQSRSRKQSNNSKSNKAAAFAASSDSVTAGERPSLTISIPTTLRPPRSPTSTRKVSEKKGAGKSRMRATARKFVRGLSRRESQEQNEDDDEFVIV